MNEDLFKKLKFEMELKNYDPKSMKAYMDSLRRFESYLGDKPFSDLTVPDIKNYIHHLLTVAKLAPNSVNRHIAAIRFLYRHVFEKYDFLHHLQNVRTPRTIPTVLSEEEVATLIDSVHNIKYKAILMLAYSAGLRNSDVRRLKVQDIDSKRMVINIRQGKGKKDRQALLSELALRCLRTYWRLFRVRSGVKSDYVFIPTKNPIEGTYDQAISHSAVGYVIKKAQEASGIKKKLHLTSFATRSPSISLNVASI